MLQVYHQWKRHLHLYNLNEPENSNYYKSYLYKSYIISYLL